MTRKGYGIASINTYSADEIILATINKVFCFEKILNQINLYLAKCKKSLLTRFWLKLSLFGSAFPSYHAIQYSWDFGIIFTHIITDYPWKAISVLYTKGYPSRHFEVTENNQKHSTSGAMYFLKHII